MPCMTIEVSQESAIQKLRPNLKELGVKLRVAKFQGMAGDIRNYNWSPDKLNGKNSCIGRWNELHLDPFEVSPLPKTHHLSASFPESPGIFWWRTSNPRRGKKLDRDLPNNPQKKNQSGFFWEQKETLNICLNLTETGTKSVSFLWATKQAQIPVLAFGPGRTLQQVDHYTIIKETTLEVDLLGLGRKVWSRQLPWRKRQRAMSLTLLRWRRVTACSLWSFVPFLTVFLFLSRKRNLPKGIESHSKSPSFIEM